MSVAHIRQFSSGSIALFEAPSCGTTNGIFSPLSYAARAPNFKNRLDSPKTPHPYRIPERAIQRSNRDNVRPTFSRFGHGQGHSRAFEPPAQRMLPTANALASEIPGLPGSRRWNPCLYLDHGVPLPWFPVTSDPQRSSFWRGRCPLPGDQRQDVREPLGHLKRDVAAMADDLGTDLDQLLAAGWSVTA